jgi:hypothetical protein
VGSSLISIFRRIRFSCAFVDRIVPPFHRQGSPILPRLPLAVAALVLLSTHQMAEGSPITYDFSGTIYNGATDWIGGNFSGSFTINTDPTVNSSGAVQEGGSDVSITLNGSAFGGTPQKLSSSALYASETPDPSGPPLIQVSITGGPIRPSGAGIGAGFAMIFVSPGQAKQLSNLGNFNFSTSTISSVQFTGLDSAGAYATSSGTITSIELVSAPEPRTWVVFAGLGIAALVYRHRRRSGDRPTRQARKAGSLIGSGC